MHSPLCYIAAALICLFIPLHVSFYSLWLLHVCVCCLLQHHMLYRSDSVDYRAQVPDMDSVVGAGSEMTPPTPAFPISPPTPYGKYCIFSCFIVNRFLSSEHFHVFVTSFVCLDMFRFNSIWLDRLVSFVVLVKNMSELTQLRQTPSPSLQSYGDYRTDHGRFKSLEHITWSCYDISSVWGKKGVFLCNLTVKFKLSLNLWI